VLVSVNVKEVSNYLFGGLIGILLRGVKSRGKITLSDASGTSIDIVAASGFIRVIVRISL